MPIVKKPKLIPCKKMRWSEDFTLEVCPGILNDLGICVKQDTHIMKIKTGFCSNGWHEGTKAKTKGGNPAPTCKFYLTCPCKCHSDLHKLYKMTEKQRELVNKSDYKTPPRQFWMPADDPDYFVTPRSTSNDIVAPVVLESPDDTRVPALLRRTFAPTASGRLARGELETMVHMVTNVWVIEEYGFPCTPQWIAEEIASDHAIPAPSTGAITAVLEKWVNLKFAVVERKPLRFVSYTPTGISMGLEKMKLSVQQAGRLNINERLRNSVG